MKILLLPSYFTPETMSSSFLDHQRYEAFAKAGMEMDLYTPMPTRGVTDEVRAEYANRKEEQMYDGYMSVHRFPLMREGENPIWRALRYVFAFVKQYHKGRLSKDIDCIYLVSTPPIQGMLGAFLKKNKGIPFVYNLQDIFPDSLVGTGLALQGGIFWKIGRIIEDYTYRNADKIIVISLDFKRNIMSKGVPEEKIEVVYNWADEKAIHPVSDEENPLFEEFGINRDKFRVVYAGNLGNAQNLNIIFEAAERLKDNQMIEFVIFGDGGLDGHTRTSIASKGLQNVRLLPFQTYERVSCVYGLGNICLVSCKAGLGGSAMPSKTWSILSAGRPVIASFDEGELKEILISNNMGVYTHSENVDEFVETVVKLSVDRERCAAMGKNGRKYVLENLTREVGTQRYVEILKSVVENKK